MKKRTIKRMIKLSTYKKNFDNEVLEKDDYFLQIIGLRLLMTFLLIFSFIFSSLELELTIYLQDMSVL